MKKIILYIAASADGFIAGPKGEIDWLEEIENPDNLDFGYNKFYNSIDTTIMGNSTYKQVLGFDIDFPYSDKENYVFTRNKKLKKDENVIYISTNFLKFVNNLKESSGKDIWLIGGGVINTWFLKNNLIDEIILTTIPILLGKGLHLFTENKHSASLKLNSIKKYDNGIVQTRYLVV